MHWASDVRRLRARTSTLPPARSLIGSVILRAGASVWFNCVLRADDEVIEVGAGSNVQDGSVIHADAGSPTLIGRDATIGHMVMLHSCLIGDETLIGNGAIVLDRAASAGTASSPPARWCRRTARSPTARCSWARRRSWCAA
jgi:carbonic anhydrase/acetyltransferase-like protein (isoleucine patch superfamily)